MRRVISVWLPTFATDRRFGQPPPADPAATYAGGRAGLLLVAINRAAQAAGLRPGLSVADARALVPGLRLAPADGAADRRHLAALADAARRYTPWTAITDAEDDSGDGTGGPFGGGAGLWLDIGGCAPLFGGEATLLTDLVRRLQGAGFTAVCAVASTPGAAFAVARYGMPKGTAVTIVPAGSEAAALASLPVAGLRLPPAIVDDLYRLGLGRIGALASVARAPLTARFGDLVWRRLDQALGRQPEPLSPRLPIPPFLARRVFAEPIRRPADIAAAARLLLVALCRQLAAAEKGARRLTLTAYHPDGGSAAAAIGTSRPSRDVDHLQRLLRDKLDGLDRGFGIEVMALAADRTEPLAPVALRLDAATPPAEDLAALIDRLANRLGEGRVLRLVPRASHLPERACHPVPASRGSVAATPTTAGSPALPPRPPLLLAAPEPVAVIAALPDGPPRRIRWRGRSRRIVAAEGPERIAPEWWRGDDEAVRDYYRTEDEHGVRLWVYRRGPYGSKQPPRWFVHGLFG